MQEEVPAAYRCGRWGRAGCDEGTRDGGAYHEPPPHSRKPESESIHRSSSSIHSDAADWPPHKTGRAPLQGHDNGTVGGISRPQPFSAGHSARKERTVELLSHLAEDGCLAIVAGFENECSAIPTTPHHVSSRRNELTAEPLHRVRVADFVARGHTGPFDVERHPSRCGRGEVEKPVRDRAVVRDREIFHMEACLPGARIDVRDI